MYDTILKRILEKLKTLYLGSFQGVLGMDEEEYHNWHFCGDRVDKEGYTFEKERHFLSDCRPDLVEHEIGDTCTWDYRRKPIGNEQNSNVIPPLPEEECCYAYQDIDLKWTTEHKHFYPDGPM